MTNIHPSVLPEFVYDFSDELDTADFLPDGFYKVADATLKDDSYFIRNPEETSRKRRGNYRWRSVTITTRWIWIFKSDGVKLSAWTR